MYTRVGTEEREREKSEGACWTSPSRLQRSRRGEEGVRAQNLGERTANRNTSCTLSFNHSPPTTLPLSLHPVTLPNFPQQQPTARHQSHGAQSFPPHLTHDGLVIPPRKDSLAPPHWLISRRLGTLPLFHCTAPTNVWHLVQDTRARDNASLPLANPLPLPLPLPPRHRHKMKMNLDLQS